MQGAQAVTAKRLLQKAGEEARDLAPVTRAARLRSVPPTGLHCRQDWSSKCLRVSLLTKLLELVLVFPSRTQGKNSLWNAAGTEIRKIQKRKG